MKRETEDAILCLMMITTILVMIYGIMFIFLSSIQFIE